MSFTKFALAACAGLFLTAQASAESLTIRWVNPPEVGIPVDVELIVVEPFEGDLGQDTELALMDRLGSASVRGEPWYELIRPRTLENAVVEFEAEDGSTLTEPLVADAALRGTVRTEVIERRIDPRIDTECVRRDDDDKCVEEKTTRVQCRELSVQVVPRIYLSYESDGGRLYAYSQSQFAKERYCVDERDIPSSLDMADGLIGGMVDVIRRDLAPTEVVRDVRIMERRRDLRREDRDAFRAAVKQTDDDPVGACAAFSALEATNPQHVSVLFNIGLCLEQRGDLDRAEDYYRRALAIDPGRDYPTDGLRRVGNARSALRLIAAREEL